jgi:hypothetical protein
MLTEELDERLFLSEGKICRRVDHFLRVREMHLQLLFLVAYVDLVGCRGPVIDRWLIMARDHIQCVELLLDPKLGADLLKLLVTIIG